MTWGTNQKKGDAKTWRATATFSLLASALRKPNNCYQYSVWAALTIIIPSGVQCIDIVHGTSKRASACRKPRGGEASRDLTKIA